MITSQKLVVSKVFCWYKRDFGGSKKKAVRSIFESISPSPTKEKYLALPKDVRIRFGLEDWRFCPVFYDQ